MSDKVLILGGGGREHCLVWKVAQSEHVGKVFVSPGNAGTLLENKTENITLDTSNHQEVMQFCEENNIDMVIIGPEAPLADGLSDTLMSHSIACFGPSKQAAQIESSKAFAKAFMDRNGIPTAKWANFTDPDEAIKHIQNAPYDALVVKASGLAAGKGVVVASSKDEAIEAVQEIMELRKFGDAGSTVVIEEKMEGEEISVFAFSDGENVACFPPAQDFKRVFDGDAGTNTGGMGAYCPVGHISKSVLEFVEHEVISKTVKGLSSEGTPFVGLLYAGLMLTKDGPKVLEFNCRFGDPETQVVLPLLESDLYEVIMECVNGDVPSAMPVFSKNKCAVTVVMASGGYPGSYKKGLPITGLEEVEELENVKVFHAGTTFTFADDKTTTTGGRVLAVTGMGDLLSNARKAAYEALPLISFNDSFYRKDIAESAAKKSDRLSYYSSGVDIDAGTSLVEAIKPLARNTSRSGVMSELGGFGALFDLRAAGYLDPILVSGTDGVGTKLKIAQSCKDFTTVGIDLVAMCVNDILAQGAEPLYFLDYFACGKLETETAKIVLGGIAKACAEAGCALLGGETAEMPGMYQEGEFDLAGFAVGAVDRNRILPKLNDISPGDVVIGLASSGIHSNGFSLVRQAVKLTGLEFDDPCPFSNISTTLGEELLIPTKLYIKSLLPLMKQGLIKAFAHITGGGLLENIPRVLPDTVGCVLDATSWEVPAVFGWLSSVGNIHPDEMLRTFNCGLGGVVIVSSEQKEKVLLKLRNSGERAWPVGVLSHAVANRSQVHVTGIESALEESLKNVDVHGSCKKFKLDRPPRTKVAVLISGTGTNLQALIDQSKKTDSTSEIALVISNKAGVMGLQRAEKAGIPTKVINHKDFKNRVDFDMQIHEELCSANIKFVCLAGFMRILSKEFVSKWRGRLVNVHPSLLPSFKGMDAHKQVLEAGVRISGCTVHFVEAEVDAGGIIIQETVPVLPGDTVDSLQERVKSVEHTAFPKAMELLTSGRVRLNDEDKVEFT